MNSIDLLRELGIIYGSTTVISLAFNYFYHTRRAKKALKEGERNLVYKDLSTSAYLNLSDLRESMKLSNKIAMVLSTVPVLQVFYTINNITKDPNYLKRYYNDYIEQINEQELLIRTGYLRKIRKIKNVPCTIEEKLKDEKYLPSETDFQEVLDYNNSDVIVKHKNLTITRKRNNSK